MREAFATARRSFDAGGGPFGAVIVRAERIVGSGMSLAEALLDPTAHAEVQAIRAAAQTLERIDLSDCVAYSSGEPCPMCLSAFYWARIGTVYYGSTAHDATRFGFEDLYLYEELKKPASSRAVVCHQLLRQEARSILSSAARERTYRSFLPPDWPPG